MTEVTKIAGMTEKKYDLRGEIDRGKETFRIGEAGHLRVGVQLISKDGGETNLHAHTGTDSAWVVLKGSASFYGINDVFVAELGGLDAVFIPSGVPYWFKNSGDEPLEILHIQSVDPSGKRERVNYAPFTTNQVARGFAHGRAPTQEELKAAGTL